MSTCDLTIELDRVNRIYHPGELVTGRVVVQVNSDCTCDNLTITRCWQTHGRGTQDDGGDQAIFLFQGTWRAGDRIIHPFEFDLLPEGPFTYHGRYINIDWYLRVAADIPWAFDPKDETEFILAPGQHRPPSLAEELPSAEEDLNRRMVGLEDSRKGGLLCTLLGGAIGAGCWLGWARLSQSVMVATFLVVLACVLGVLGLCFAGRVLVRLMVARKLGPVLLSLGPRSIHPGGQITCEVRLQPPQPVVIKRVRAMIWCEESTIHDLGTNEITRTSKVYKERTDVSQRVLLHPGELTTLSAQLLVPADAPLSFSTCNNKVEWFARVRVDVPWCPDWVEQYDLTVRP